MRIAVKFVTNVPDNAADKDIQEWLDFHLHVGPLAVTNDIGDKDMDAEAWSVAWHKI